MNRGVYKYTIKQRIINFLFPDYIMNYLECMRYLSYYRNKNNPIWIWYNWRYRRLGLKLGFSIGYNVFGYGLVIPHYGTIVVGSLNTVGNYAVLQTSTCVSNNEKIIGDGLYLATGSVITSKVKIGNNCSVAANSVVNKSFFEDNLLIAGVPATIIKKTEPWFLRDGISFVERRNKIEELKELMNL